MGIFPQAYTTSVSFNFQHGPRQVSFLHFCENLEWWRIVALFSYWSSTYILDIYISFFSHKFFPIFTMVLLTTYSCKLPVFRTMSHVEKSSNSFCMIIEYLFCFLLLLLFLALNQFVTMHHRGLRLQYSSYSC